MLFLAMPAMRCSSVGFAASDGRPYQDCRDFLVRNMPTWRGLPPRSATEQRSAPSVGFALAAAAFTAAAGTATTRRPLSRVPATASRLEAVATVAAKPLGGWTRDATYAVPGIFTGDRPLPDADECDCQRVVRTIVIVPPLLSPADCDMLIKSAQRFASRVGWKAAQHVNYPTDDVKVSNLDAEALKIYERRVVAPLTARIAEAYGLPAEDVCAADAFLVRYAFQEGQTSLARHRDGSIVSSTVSLSDAEDYDGGGTCIDGEAYRPEQGGAVLFGGARVHSGGPITRGTRYILTIFWTCRDYDCHCLTQDENPLWEGSPLDVNIVAAVATLLSSALLYWRLYEALGSRGPLSLPWG